MTVFVQHQGHAVLPSMVRERERERERERKVVKLYKIAENT